MTHPIILLSDSKLAFLRWTFLHNDAIHIYIGMVTLLVVCRLTIKRLDSYRLLIPGFVLSLLMEVPDIWFNVIIDHPHDYPDSLKDIFNTNILPVMLIASARLKWF